MPVELSNYIYMHVYNVHKQWSSDNESAVGTDYHKVQKVGAQCYFWSL